MLAAAKRTGSAVVDEQTESESDDEILALDDSLVSEDAQDSILEKLLVWNDEATPLSKAAYTGDSRWTSWRRAVKKHRRHESVKSDPKIFSFFPKIESEIQQVPAECPITLALQKLNQQIDLAPNAVKERQNRETSKWDCIRKIAVRNYLKFISEKQPKIESSEKIASMLFPSRNVSHSGRLIRQWAESFISSGELPIHHQGKFVKKKSLIHDEDVQLILREFIRTEKDVSLTSTKVSEWVNEYLHVKLGLVSPLNISSRTAQRWLNLLGLRFGKHMKGLYNDGHERNDVVRYRDAFLERMSLYEKRMIQYVGDLMETSISPELADDEKVLILVTHDESCFGSNDGRSYCWIDENNRQIRPKGNGRSVMVSAFLCECHGILKLSKELQALHPEVPADSTVLLKPGTNAEGYWKNSDLVTQVKEKALPIFKILHPNCDGLFMFDNSQNHHARAPDALSVSNMNLRNGGANQRLMRNGWFVDTEGNRIQQKMVLEDGVTSKGLAQVLKERGLWHALLNVKEAKRLLSEQPDFLEQREWLEETIVHSGYLIDFYPKYHCEFNYIEMFWGAAKAWCRARCTFNFNDHVKLVPQALDSVSIAKIRKFARKSYRYIDAYRVKDTGGSSLSVHQIEYAVKKYHGHRKIPMRILEIGNLYK